MAFDLCGKNLDIALIESSGPVLQNAQDALDLIMSVCYETGLLKCILPKERLSPAFFSLRTGLAGEVLQKFINYHMKVAIVGDYAGYKSGPLRDFIYESNNGRDIFFVGTVADAIKRLEDA